MDFRALVQKLRGEALKDLDSAVRHIRQCCRTSPTGVGYPELSGIHGEHENVLILNERLRLLEELLDELEQESDDFTQPASGPAG